MSVRQPVNVLRDWCTRCLDEGRNVTDWEKQFLESISDQLTNVGTLSERQEAILERIYCQRTS